MLPIDLLIIVLSDLTCKLSLFAYSFCVTCSYFHTFDKYKTIQRYSVIACN